MNYRIEKDTIGEIKIPEEVYWGPHTQRAIENFKISNYKFPQKIIKSIVAIKLSAAITNKELGLLDEKIADAIISAAKEVMYTFGMEHFPIDVFQTGSGTSTNMNVNEVISTRANEILTGKRLTTSPVHPNDHVNKCQSSNDVIPSSIRIATAIEIENELIPSLKVLVEEIDKKSRQIGKIIKTGRTHLMDAVPITFGQELSGWKQQIEYGIERIKSTFDRLLELPLGGTAVGTGINAHPEFSDKVVKNLSKIIGIEFRVARNKFEAQSAIDVASEVSGHLKTISASLIKIANDLRLMNSGPSSGIGEIILPSLQAGSSIMPGKVNPVIPEAVRMACARVMGNDTTITISCSLGDFQLNTMLPIIGFCLMESLTLISSSAKALAHKAIQGMKVNKSKVEKSLQKNPIIATNLVPLLGYEKTAEIVKKAIIEDKTIKEILLEMNILPEGKIEEYIDFSKMI